MPSFSFNQENINKLIEISKSAGKAIMDIYHSDFHIESKKDSSPLTKADILSNEIICSALSKLDPSIPILSEESSNISFNRRSKWKDYWLVDPLDGTKEFINKNGEFTTNIAFISNNQPQFGIIHAPAINQTFWGDMERGAFNLLGDSESDIRSIKASEKPNSKIRIVTSRSHPSSDLAILLKKLDDYDLISIGSSLKFCLIANGDADCYPRLGPICEWDIAAGDIIARASGASSVTTQDLSIQYNLNESFLSPHFIVANTAHNKYKVLSLL